MPSEKILERKKQHVADITELLKGSAAGVLVDYRGLTVEQDTKLRSKLRESGVKYSVIKNTMLRFASDEAGLGDLDPILHGPTALATSADDVVAPAKVLMTLQRRTTRLKSKRVLWTVR